MRKKTGRPRTPENKQKNRYLQVRVDEFEVRAFHDAADLAGLALSGWVRVRLRECATRELRNAGKNVAFVTGKY